MKKASGFVVFVFFIITTSIPSALFAAPMPEAIYINEETKQCTRHMGGDECNSFILKGSWESLGWSRNECPDGYERVDDVEIIQQPVQNEFCCQYGSPGHCQTLTMGWWRALLRSLIPGLYLE